VSGAWGKQGATFVDLKKVRKDMFLDALTTAYKNVALKKRLLIVELPSVIQIISGRNLTGHSR